MRKQRSGKPMRMKKPRKNYARLFDAKNGLDYKDIPLVEQFVTERGRLIPRRITGLNAQQQRLVTLAVKRARVMALLPFVATQHR